MSANGAALPSRVLMTADAVGGVWTYALDLARALVERSTLVLLATMGPEPSVAQRRQANAIPGLELATSTCRLEWMEDPWEEVATAGEWLLALERRFRPKLVHLNGYAHAGLPWHAPTLIVAHSDVLSWWSAVKGEAAPAAWNRYREAVGRGLAAADAVVALTHAGEDGLRKHYGYRGEARVIPNGRDGRLYRTAAKEPLVLAAGRLWDEAKNLAVLQTAADGLPWPVYVAGDEEHPAGGRIPLTALRQLGKLSPEELAGWYGRASLYALPARYEPFGLSALEAALSGCALVLGDIPTLRELWDGAAVFVEPSDAEALREALRTLINDPARRETLAQSALARAVRYTPETMAARYFKLYEDLCPTRRSATLAS